eukprot:2453184-Alexandrium_andersonii.AAC.1
MARKVWFEHPDWNHDMRFVWAGLVDSMHDASAELGENVVLHETQVVLHVEHTEGSGSEAQARGPMALLMLALARAGCRVGRDWELYVQGFPVMSLLWEPWQMLVQALWEAHATRAVSDNLCTRASIEGAQHADWAMTRAYPKEWSSER